MTKSQHGHEAAVEEMSLAELAKRADKALALIDQIDEQFPGLQGYSEEDRRTTAGRLRDGESDALRAVLDTADARPQVFAVLADKDGGSDPKRFETAWLREMLARRDTLDRVRVQLEQLTSDLSDTVLHLGELVQRPALAAYQIAKPLAQHDDAIARTLKPALDFYGRIGRAGVRTRARKAGAAKSTT
jgi:hypothetical protein